MSFLRIDGLRVEFGGLVALDNLELRLEAGHIHGIIGPNGAGKTTLLNVITRLYIPTRGTVEFDGNDLLAARPHNVARLGICRTFQNVELFAGLSVLENVMLGHLTRSTSGFAGALLRTRGARRDLARAASQAVELLEFVGLKGLGHREATALPFAQQKLIELARALAAGPRLLLLDEPAAAMTGGEVAQLRRLLQRVRDEWGVTILLVEHVMDLVMGSCSRVTVLNYGKKIAAGVPGEIRREPAVIAAYLGARGAGA